MGSLLRGWLYDLAPQDPVSLALAIAVLLAVIVVASLGPALRAMRVDLATVLRD